MKDAILKTICEELENQFKPKNEHCFIDYKHLGSERDITEIDGYPNLVKLAEAVEKVIKEEQSKGENTNAG